jgi:hypothetical protein
MAGVWDPKNEKQIRCFLLKLSLENLQEKFAAATALFYSELLRLSRFECEPVRGLTVGQ